MTQEAVVAVTGASGYVGSVIARALADEAHVVGMVRSPRASSDIDWSFETEPRPLQTVLRERGVTQLVHAAWDMTGNSEEELERSCVSGSERLLRSARDACTSRLIFISSISAFDGARSAYGRSKLKVERMFLAAGGIVLRLGLVYGSGDGGLFGSLRKTVRGARFVPLIGRGKQVQYLLHEETLGDVIRRAVRGDLDGADGPITIAHPRPVPFRDLVHHIAAGEHRKVKLVPLPWQLLYAGVKGAELAGLKLGFRSDSIISFVHQDRAPDFRPMHQLGIEPRPLV